VVDSPQPPPEAAGSEKIPHVVIRYSHARVSGKEEIGLEEIPFPVRE
jgi:hypothetical protein